MQNNKVHFSIIGVLCILIFMTYCALGVNKWEAVTKTISLAFSIYLAGWLIFDRWVWKRGFILKLTGIENLNGKWKGTLYSSYGEGVTKETAVTIVQTFSKVVIKNKTNEIESISFLHKWEREMPDKKKELFYMYRTDPKNEFKDKNPTQYGSARIRFDSDDHKKLRIEYWTDRKTVGHMLLTRAEIND